LRQDHHSTCDLVCNRRQPIGCYNVKMTDADANKKITLRDVRRWVEQRQPFAMLTCYDATTARWLWRGGIRTLLVGDTASEMILGHESTLPVEMDFMVQITAAVRRGAPQAMIMADMPFGSYQCGDREAMANAVRFIKQGQADWVKLEVDASFGKLVERMARSGVPVVAHIGSRPQMVRATGGYQRAGRDQAQEDELVETARLMVEVGASAILIEAVPQQVAERVVERVRQAQGDAIVPVIGCGAGPACDGQVVVLHDLLGMTDWQPPFARPLMNMGKQISQLAQKWIEQVRGSR